MTAYEVPAVALAMPSRALTGGSAMLNLSALSAMTTSNAWVLVGHSNVTGKDYRTVLPMRYIRRAGVASLIRLAREVGTCRVELGRA